MNISDKYHKWIERSDEDQVYVGKCPDLITGIHGDDPIEVYRDLCSTIEGVLEQILKEGKPVPPAKTRPMIEVV